MFHMRAIMRGNLRRVYSLLAVQSLKLPSAKKPLPSSNWRYHAPHASLWATALVSADPRSPRTCFAEDRANTTLENPRLELKCDDENDDESATEDEIGGGEERYEEHRILRLMDRISDIRIVEDAEPRVRAFCYSLVGSYVAIYAASMFGRYLTSASVPNQKVINFLGTHFLLTLAHIRSGRQYVLLTYMFCHASIWHLVANSLASFIAIDLSSHFLNVWEIAALYFGGGIIGGAVSLLVSRYLLAARYRTRTIGSSGGIFALFYFSWCAKNKGSGWLRPEVTNLLYTAIIAREAYGIGVYLRDGAIQGANWSPRQNHVIHLAGALTGLAAFFASEVIQKAYKRRNLVLTSSSTSTLTSEKQT